MLYTTYRGYVNFSIVIIFIIVVMLLIIIIFFFFIFISNFDLIVVSLKVLNRNFFGEWEILLSVWNLFFLIMVLIIRIRVGVFSFSYIARTRIRNFIGLYVSFILRIVWLILNNNFYWIILGWDGLGVVSFLLIIFYINYERVRNGIFTLFQNRIGDLFFVLFIVGLLRLGITRRIYVKVGLIRLILGACVKSAQYPFNSWLLAAIRAPTPISSLVHSSTLVVAGVYILLQFRYCLEDVLDVLKYVRILTLLVRRWGLLIELDIKKLIAYSTLSHVSLIIIIIRVKLFKVTYFHLNIHAIFKSTIFICFGYVILVSFHAQDKRLVSLVGLNPLIKIIYYFSCLCLIGLPFLRGFFSKDFIIEKFIDNSKEFFLVVLLLLFLRISVYYRIKLLNLIYIVFPYTAIEKNYIGIFSVVIMRVVIIFVINIFLRLIVRLRLEILSFKIIIYLFISCFLILRLLSNLNLKFNTYDKIKNFFEVWVLDVYKLDQFIYWNILGVIRYVNQISGVKLILLMNWWVLFFIIIVF